MMRRALFVPLFAACLVSCGESKPSPAPKPTPAEPSKSAEPEPEPASKPRDPRLKPYKPGMRTADPKEQELRELMENPPVGDEPLLHGLSSIDAVGQAVVDAMNEGDEERLKELSVSTRKEYERLLPAIANTTSAFKMPLEFLFTDFSEDSAEERRENLDRFGKKNLEFVDLEITGEVIDRKKIVRHGKPRLVVKTEDGEQKELRFVGTIVEHVPSKTFKVLNYR